MIKEEQLRLSLLLAFQTVITHGGKITEDSQQKILALAQRMNDFCELYLSKAFPSGKIDFAEDSKTAKIDFAIETHKRELKTSEITRLPEDRGSLIQLYDRLQQRKARRMQWQFYATVKAEKVADLVMRLLNEEVEENDVEARQ